MYMNVLPACVLHVCVLHVCLVQGVGCGEIGAKRGHWGPWKWSSQTLVSCLVTLGIKPGSSARTASALNP